MLATLIVVATAIIVAAPATSSDPVTPSGTQDVAYVTTSPIVSAATGATAKSASFTTSRYTPSDGAFTAELYTSGLYLQFGGGSLRLTSADGVSPLRAGIHDSDAASTNPIEVAFNVGGRYCSDNARSVVDISDLSADDYQIHRLALTFTISCGSLQTTFGEVLFHEPLDPTLQASPSRLDFGRQDPGTRRDVTVQLRNQSSAPVAIKALSAAAPFQVQAGSCQAATLAPGGTCDLTVRFTPTAAGSFSGMLNVSDSSATGHHAVPLTGIGRAGSTRFAVQVGASADRRYAYQQASGDDLQVTLGPDTIEASVTGVDRRSWQFRLETPVTGPELSAGHVYATVPTTATAASSASAFVLDVSGPNHGYDADCPGVVYVRELTAGAGGWITHADLLFAQTCPGTATQSRGELSYSATAPTSAIGRLYNALGSYTNKQLGLPTSVETAITGGSRQLTQLGQLLYSPTTGAHEVDGVIETHYLATGGTSGRLGFPTSDTLPSANHSGWHTNFTGGSIYYSPQLGAHAVYGPIRATWDSLGAENGRLGYPVSDEAPVAGGRRSTFQFGTITWNQFTGRTTVAYRR